MDFDNELDIYLSINEGNVLFCFVCHVEIYQATMLITVQLVLLESMDE
jgi:hypothetical protein